MDVRAEELLRPATDDVEATFELDRPPVVGEGLTGTVSLRATRTIDARGARFRLLGLRLVEERRSETHQRADGTSETESWVEATGRLFVEDAFLEPVIPADLQAGQVFDATFAVPMPALGPPSGHLGVAIVAWALEVRWDISLAPDSFVAFLLPLEQNPSLIRAGVGKQGGQALLASLAAGPGATIAIESPLPAPPGSTMLVRSHWPGAASGRSARVELVQDVDAPNGETRVLATATTTIDEVRAGSVAIALPIPLDAAPSFDGGDLACRYDVRVVIDRPMRPDDWIDRPVSIA